MAGAIGGHGRRSLSLGGNDRVLPVRPRRAAACGRRQRGPAAPLVGPPRWDVVWRPRPNAGGGGDAVRLCPGSARLRHVAGALQFSLPDQLRHRRTRRAAFRGGPRADFARRAGLGLCVLWPANPVASPLGAALSGCGVAPIALHRLPPGTDLESPGALGAAPGAPVRCGSLDSLPTDGHARHRLNREQRTEDRRQKTEDREHDPRNRRSIGETMTLRTVPWVFCPLSAVFCPLSSVFCPLSSVLCSLSPCHLATPERTVVRCACASGPATTRSRYSPRPRRCGPDR